MKYFPFIFIFLLASCASNKTDSKNDFYIDEITITEGVNESDVKVIIKPVKGIVFLDMFYKNNKAKIIVDNQNTILSSYFKKNIPIDINLSADPKDEYGNTPPVQTKTPLMDKNELIISYKKSEGESLMYKVNYLKYINNKSFK